MPESELVEAFRREHAELLSLAEQLEQSIDEPQLDAFRHQLLDHLDREDELFYPELERLAAGEGRIRRILDVFAKDRAEVTSAAHNFFAGRSPASAGEAQVDYQGLLRGLRERILRSDDSMEIADEVLRFFKTHPEVWATPGDPSDFKEFVKLVRARIYKEETVLFKLYESL